MVDVMNSLKPDAMTAHWEFTYGADRVKEIVENLPFAFLGQNIFDNEWDEPAFDGTKMFERGGVKIAVIGQAFPYMPIANPRWMFPNLSFGIREEQVQKNVDAAREAGAQVVVLLSHNGFDVDRKLASRVKGIDVILTGHTHDALPEPVIVGKTLLIASGSHGKFLSRSISTCRAARSRATNSSSFRFSPTSSPGQGGDRTCRQGPRTFEENSRPYSGKTESLLYRRGNFNGTFDDLICDALISPNAKPISRCRRASAGERRSCRVRTSRSRTSTTRPA
jgi:sulfur-oxidizing protein SoxB